MSTILHKYTGRKRIYPGYPIARKQGGTVTPAQFIALPDVTFSPTVLLVGDTNAGVAGSSGNNVGGSKWKYK